MDLIDREADEGSADEVEEGVRGDGEESDGIQRDVQQDAVPERNGVHHDDSAISDSSEEEDDDDEEAAKKVREGFIVDSDEEEERTKKRKRRNRERVEEAQEDLDEDDLDLVLESSGIRVDRERGKTLKRLKRGRDREKRAKDGGLLDIFSDDEAPAENGNERRGMLDEFADFIENDYSEDEVEREEREVRRDLPKTAIRPESLGMTEDAYEKVMEIFGTGDDYDWALEGEDEVAEEREKQPELRDVFEPSELEDRMLTEEDQQIRTKDEPERFQIMRKAYADVQLSENDIIEEGEWIYNRLVERRQVTHQYLDPLLTDAYRHAVKQVLDFFIRDLVEPPFVWQHRRDYLVHTKLEGSGEEAQTISTPLISKDELWRILELDIRFRSLIQKRNAVQSTLQTLQGDDEEVDVDALMSTTPRNAQMEDYQDMNDFIHFKYSAVLREVPEKEANGVLRKRSGIKFNFVDKMRNGHIYGLVKDFGISSSDFAMNVANGMRHAFTQDPEYIPELIANRYVDEDWTTWQKALRAAKTLLVEEIFHEPLFRQAVRINYFRQGTLNVHPTEKGIRRIDDFHPYADFKYLRQWSVLDAPRRPERFLQMLEAEREGLVEVKVVLSNGTEWFSKLCDYMASDSYSDTAESWNIERREVLEMVVSKIDPMMQRAVKENLKSECESLLALEIRRSLYNRLNRMPWKPHRFEAGEIPKVLSVSCGLGEYAGDATLAVFLNEFGDVMENIKLDNMKDADSREQMAALIKRKAPDVIAMAGFNVDTRRLEANLVNFIDEYALKIPAGEDGIERSLKVIFVNDEVARLYHNSKRASVEFPDLPSLAKYCVALGRYMQSPLLEYAAMGRDLTSIPFHKSQGLLLDERVYQTLETALVDIVNKVGVELNETLRDSYKGNVIPFICGLGPRKWSGIQRAISARGGWLYNRSEFITNQIMGRIIFMNCSSFVRIPYKPTNKQIDTAEFLDSTRLHPEDYELGRKMAADALELDEEDLVDLEQSGGVVYELHRKDETFKLNLLVLEEYADQLEKRFNQRKRITLDIVKWELQNPFGELRSPHESLTDFKIFTMLTGENPEYFHRGSIISANVRRVGLHYVTAQLDCGVEANIDEMELSDDPIIKPSQVVQMGNTVEAVIDDVNYATFDVQLSIRARKIRDAKDLTRTSRQYRDMDGAEWAEFEEEKDRSALAAKQPTERRTARVIKHPLFRPFNAQQAEQFLSTMQRGDAVIRPSSNGLDHIAVTWKVGEGVFQHIDVLELGKENEFSLGKLLRINNKYNYSDLDELIVSHIKAMARKVDEITNHEKFQKGIKSDTENWLTTYSEANPKRSSYAFCTDSKNPGYFDLCFKAGLNAPVNSWPVKVIPNAFSLRGTEYGDMNALCNGFKMMHTSMTSRRR